jgi:superfamily II DNA or RNA helicase
MHHFQVYYSSEEKLPRFITNQNRLLAEILETYIPHSKQLDFLVGYFFFSGFNGIYKEIKDKKLRILVGMNADVTVQNAIREWMDIDSDKPNSGQSIFKIRQLYQEKTKKIINEADIADTQEGENSFKFFVEKLNNGTLEVKKTQKPVHAKMYIFTNTEEHCEGGEYPGKVIVGSSNLSFQGLQGQTEINVTLRDNSDYLEALDIFNKLWDEAIPLVDVSTKDEFFERVIKHTWPDKCPSPYLVYIRVLHEFFKPNSEAIKTPSEITHTGDVQYLNLVYQIDAINEGLSMIKRHSGCIIADVVGLGKSIIGAAIAANLNLTTIIICPPHLKAQWEEFAFDFGLHKYYIVSSGKLEEALDLTLLGINEKLIIVDEAHRYRNENTHDYGLLHKTCIGNKVLLLSATPFNNRPEDIFSLIKLFQIPSYSTIQTVNNLGAAMESLIIEYKKLKKEHAKEMSEAEFKIQAKEISSKIRDILQPVLIRRTRLDLLNDERYKEDLTKQGIVFSDVEPPEEQEYELGPMSDLYIETLNQLSGILDSQSQVFTGARYQPLTYLKDDPNIIEKYRKLFDNTNPQEGQRNMASFMRRLLVRRFESSVYSFKKTLANIITSMNNVKKWYVNFKKIPLYKTSSLPDFDSLEECINEEMDDALFAEGIDDILERILTPQIEKGLILVNADEITDSFINDLNSDIALFTEILSKWNKDDYKNDLKIEGILTRIQESLKKEPNRKIIIFSEFKDTVDYLEEQFKERKLRVIKYTSKTQYSKNIIKLNFDAGIKAEHQKDDYDVLVATDAISEGFSLHRAGTIYNYDIPYNPTRVIQRVGRINRINKKVFDKLNIYNFFPSTTGESLSRTKQITTFKMLLIQSIFGSDTKILTADEITEGYLTEEYKKAKAEVESPSWGIEFKNELRRIQNTEKDIYDKALELPQRCRTGRKAENAIPTAEDLFAGADKKGVMLFSKKSDALRFTFTDENGGSRVLSPLEGISLFKALPNEKSLQTTENFYNLYKQAKAQSGISSERTIRSKNTAELNNKIIFLKKQLANISENSQDIVYLDKLRKITGTLDSLPLYYTKQLLDVDIKKISTTITEFKNLVPEKYINVILEKHDNILNETETILLSEQFI